MATSNLSAAEAVALNALALGAEAVNLLSPAGVVGGAIGDILAAATDLFPTANLVNAALANFQNVPLNDPIGAAFSTGQPYGGAFLTAPTTTQIQQINFDSSLSSSTQSLSQLSSAQVAALSAQTGVTINSDADLGIALATVFSTVQANQTLAFSLDLGDDSTLTPLPVPVASPVVTPAYAIPPITAKPNMAALQAFVSQMASAFPNTSGLGGVAASIWVDGLGISTTSSGTVVTGIPTGISPGVYSDIANAAATLTSVAPVTLVDYSLQQNQLNLYIALAIDNGLSTIVNQTMSTSGVTPATNAVIKNRLASVAQRGDAQMLAQLFAILGANNVPNATSLISSMLQNAQPIDATAQTGFPSTNGSKAINILKPVPVTPSFTASGITLTTQSAELTRSQIIGYTNEMLTEMAITAQTLITQNTCDSVLCSMEPYNVAMIKQMDMTILETLLDPTTIEMAYMF